MTQRASSSRGVAAGLQDAPFVLEARGVSKRYGAVRALQDVDLVVSPGSVHALVGENGAGKSTLAKVLSGTVAPGAGSMLLAGRPYAPRDRTDARAAGVSMVPQHLSLVGELSLVENLLLTGTRALVSRRSARARLADVLQVAGVRVSLDAPTASLSQAHRQLGEIVVALAEGARTLVLDEPTASLGPLEVGGLFEHLRALRDLGTAVVLITHRLEEVRSVADEVTVLSHGRRVHHGGARGLEPARIAELMVGELPPPHLRARREPGAVVLRAQGLHRAQLHDASLRDVDLQVRAGEVVGVAGVAGSGQNALLDVLAGLAAPDAGTVSVDGEPLTSAAAALRAGVAWLPEERTHALVPTATLGQVLSVYDSATVRAGRDARDARSRSARRAPDSATGVLTAFDVRPPDPSLAVAGLSGGNQQKLMVARELATAWPDGGRPRVVLAHGPSQGLDLRAARAVRERLLALAEAGSAVLVASQDLEELLDVADRVVVLFDGRVVADLPVHEATPQRVGEAMAGLTGSPPCQQHHPSPPAEEQP